MNAPRLKKMLRLGAVLAIGPSVAACAGSFDPPTDADSPAAARVEALVAAHRQYPRWEDFPPAPTGLPQPADIAARVGQLEVDKGALAADVARIDWTLDDPAGFAAMVTSRIDAALVSPVTAVTQADIEDFARRLRERATAPPPIDRR